MKVYIIGVYKFDEVGGYAHIQSASFCFIVLLYPASGYSAYICNLFCCAFNSKIVNVYISNLVCRFNNPVAQLLAV